MRYFVGTAARQKRDNRLARVQSTIRGKLRAWPLRRHLSHQRMANEIGFHAARAVPVLFKRENANSAHESPPHQVGAPGPPGPELRTHKVDVLHPLSFHGPRQSQMKAR